MNKEDFIEGFMWGISFGMARSSMGKWPTPEEQKEQAEYEWRLYSGEGEGEE